MVTETHEAIQSIRLAKRQMEAAAARVESGEFGEDLTEQVREAADSAAVDLGAVEEELIQTRNESSQDPLNYPPMIDNQIVYVYGHANSGYGRPTAGTMDRITDLRSELDVELTRLESVFATAVARFNQLLAEAGIPAIVTSSGEPPISD